MSPRNIILMLLLTGLFYSCVDEEFVGYCLEPASLSVKLNIGNVETKAYGIDQPYTYATAEELYVDKCAIAIFDMEKTDKPLIAFKYAQSGSDDFVAYTTTQNDTLAWGINNIETKARQLLVLAIANLAEAADFGNLPNYAAFTEQITSARFDNNYDPNTLVKVGAITTTLTPGTNEIEVPMTQLAARVDLKIKLDLPEIEPISYVGEIPPEHLTSSLELFRKDTKDYPSRGAALRGGNFVENIVYAEDGTTILRRDTVIAWECKGNEHGDGTKHPTIHFTYEGKKFKTESSDGKFAVVEGLYLDSISIEKRWALKLYSIKVNNIQMSSNLFVGQKNPVSLETEKDLWQKEYGNGNGIYVTDSVSIRFYTYEKMYELNMDQELTIDIESSLVEVVDSTVTKLMVNAHAAWWDGNKKNFSGWGDDGKQMVFVLIAPSVTQVLERMDPEPTQTSINETKEYYQIRFNPSLQGTQHIESGNIYDLTATIDERYIPLVNMSLPDNKNAGPVISKGAHVGDTFSPNWIIRRW